MSGRRTYDTDSLVVRKIFALDSTNKPIPALQTLTSDGSGGTFWAVPQALGGLPSFNAVDANGTQILANAPFNTLTMTTEGMGLDVDPTTNTMNFFG